MDAKKIQEEKTQLFTDVYSGKTPRRVPMTAEIKWEAAIEYCGMNVRRCMWDIDQAETFTDKVSSEFDFDTMPVPPTGRHPLMYKILGAKGIVMSETGAMQHPEVHSLEASEYDEFISDPYKCVVDKLAPRIYENLTLKNGLSSLTLAKAYAAKQNVYAKLGQTADKIRDKYGFAALPSGGFTVAPMDFLSDFVRSFSGILSDIRRCPGKVEEACEALLPHVTKVGITPSSSIYARTFIPLHMGPYLNNKHFEKLWWPSFEKLMHNLTDNGCGVCLFAEQDWTNRVDYLESLPGRVELYFEYGDSVKIADTIKNKHIIEGLYPSVMLMTNTKEQCVEKAKELLDTLAPEGNYIFNLDKSLYSLKGRIEENTKAVIEYVKEAKI